MDIAQLAAYFSSNYELGCAILRRRSQLWEGEMLMRWLRVATLAVVTTVAAAVVQPAPASADTTEDILIWTGVGTGVAIVVVLIAVYFTRDEDALFLTEPPRDPRLLEESGVQFGTACRNPDGSAALLCW